jgi:hypothetical protein
LRFDNECVFHNLNFKFMLGLDLCTLV